MQRSKFVYRLLATSIWKICAVAMLLPYSVIAAAQTKASDTLWRMYFNAAIAELQDSQNATDDAVRKSRQQDAVILLQSALPVGNRIDPGGPRPRMTSWLLYFVYFELGDGDSAVKILKASQGVNLDKFGADLLPVAKPLDSLATTYIDHNGDKAFDSSSEYFTAYKCLQFETAILANAYPADDIRLALPTATYGFTQMHLGSIYFATAKNSSKAKDRDSNMDAAEVYLKNSIDSYSTALKIWAKNQQQEAKLTADGQRYMVSSLEASSSAKNHNESGVGVSDLQDPNTVSILLSEAYQQLGDLYTANKQPDKAKAQFKNAEAPLETSLKAFQEIWPQHQDVANSQYRLALLYTEENRYQEADRLMCDALQITRQNEGAHGTDTTFLEQQIASSLKTQGLSYDAHAVAQACSAKVQ